MARRVFYSFHYDGDKDRVAQVRNMGVVEGTQLASDNDWEHIKRGGETAIRSWIEHQMAGTSCCIVLIGASTAGRKWVTYEISEAWNRGKGVLGIHIYGLKDLRGFQSNKGLNPFDSVTHNSTGRRLSQLVRVYEPPTYDSKACYGGICDNLGQWIEEAIRLRGLYG